MVIKLRLFNYSISKFCKVTMQSKLDTRKLKPKSCTFEVTKCDFTFSTFCLVLPILFTPRMSLTSSLILDKN